MQCPSCRFHNMPGLTTCVRCGSNFDARVAIADITPPRAKRKRGLRQQRLQWSWNRSIERFQAWCQNAKTRFDNAGLTSFLPKHLSRDLFFRSLVPGWGQLWLNRRYRAAGYIAGYGTLVLSSIVFHGSMVGNTLLGLAFAVHASSVMDVWFEADARLLKRLTQGLLIFAILAFVYYPVGPLSRRFAQPWELGVNQGSIRAGDVLIADPHAEIEPANLVVFFSDEAIEARFGYSQMMVPAGTRIGRVLARGGQYVQRTDAGLLVDGEPLHWQGMEHDFRHIPNELENMISHRMVPWDSVLVLANEVSGIPRAGTLAFPPRMLLLDRQAVRGAPYWRTWPIHRWGSIQ
ncbi:MAG: zinc finger Ran-binding domain-containing protein [Planctomycetota bacterium]